MRPSKPGPYGRHLGRPMGYGVPESKVSLGAYVLLVVQLSEGAFCPLELKWSEGTLEWPNSSVVLVEARVK